VKQSPDSIIARETELKMKSITKNITIKTAGSCDYANEPSSSTKGETLSLVAPLHISPWRQPHEARILSNTDIGNEFHLTQLA
jgi:hypothetical protein